MSSLPFSPPPPRDRGRRCLLLPLKVYMSYSYYTDYSTGQSFLEILLTLSKDNSQSEKSCFPYECDV